MEIQFQSEPSKRKKGSRSSTRMYAPTHSKKRAVAFAPLTEEQNQAEQQAVPAPEEARRKKPASQIKPFTRFMLVVCSFIFAGMILFVLTGYERISRAYSDINTLNVQIEEAELNINALNAAIECAVTIDQAQEWAKSHNMQYPNQSQYVRAGSSIPIAADPTAPTEGAPTEGAPADGVPAEGTVPAEGAAPATTPEDGDAPAAPQAE